MKKIFSSIFVFICATYTIFSCSNIFNQSMLFSGRTIDFGFKAPLSIVCHPAGTTIPLYIFQGGKLDGKTDWPLLVKYGYLSGEVDIDWSVLDMTLVNTTVSFDGINERGLGVCSLEFNESIKNYQAYNAASTANVDAFYLPHYLLSQCATVAECTTAMQGITVTGVLPDLAGFGSHIMVQDSTGASAVYEYINGQLNVYDASAYGVATYSPAYNLQIANLQNYADVTNINPIDNADTSIAEYGNGGGMIPVRADATPPDRFVRGYFFNKFAQIPSNATFTEKFSIMDSIIGKVNVINGEAIPGSWWQENIVNKYIMTINDFTQITFIRCHDPALGYGYFWKYYYNSQWQGLWAGKDGSIFKNPINIKVSANSAYPYAVPAQPQQ